MFKVQAFSEKTPLSNELKSRNLKEPLGLVKKIEEVYNFLKSNVTNPNNFRNGKLRNETRYVSMIELYKNKLLLRTWAWKTFRNKIIYKEVQRQIEGENVKLIKDMYYTSIGGYHTIWQEKYYYRFFDEYFWEAHLNYYEVAREELFEFEDVLKLDPSLKHCGFIEAKENRWIRFNIINYISIYRVFPQIEILSKKKILYLFSDSRFINRMVKDKKFVKFVNNNLEELQKKQYKYTAILQAYKSKQTVAYYSYYIDITNSNIYINNIDILKPKIEKIYKYLIENGISLPSYLDYLEAAKDFVPDLSDTKVLYPHEFMRWHDHYIARKEEIKNENLIKSLKKVVKKFKKYEYVNGKYAVKIAETLDDFKKEGEALKHCVAKMGYDKKMSEEETLIYFIRKKEIIDTPFYTIEVEPKSFGLIQCHGENNKSPTSEIMDFIHEWQVFHKNKKEQSTRKGEKACMNNM